jgi:hypothetical protein
LSQITLQLQTSGITKVDVLTVHSLTQYKNCRMFPICSAPSGYKAKYCFLPCEAIPEEVLLTLWTNLLSQKNGVFWDVTPCGSCKNRRFEDLGASFIRVTRIGELGTTLAVTSNRRTLRRNTIFAAVKTSNLIVSALSYDIAVCCVTQCYIS